MPRLLPNESHLSSWSSVPTSSIALTDAGLVGGAGSTFMRMRKGSGVLAFDSDCDRLVALMSVAANRPVAEAEVLPHVMAAAAHWQRGDKALANIRLVFANLPKVADPTSAYRVALAEQLLNNGWSSRALLVELGLAGCASYKKYNPDQPRIPAGHGRQSGEWDFWPDAQVVVPATPDGRIVVAMEGGSPEDEKTFEEHEILGVATPSEEIAHGHPIRPSDGMLGGANAVAEAPEPNATIEVPLSRFGQAAQHILDAQVAGQPDLLTIARANATSNRAAATQRLPKVPDMHLDEYPLAMFQEGGSGASVRAIDPTANKSLGAYIGRRCSTFPDGSKIRIKVVP